MKKLLLIRHAKSDWNDPSLDDIDRPLNERGKKDAPEMAKRMVDRKVEIDAFITSPAKRARRTATKFAKAYNKSKGNVEIVDELYAAPPSVFYNVIAKAKDKYETIAVFGHNPGLTDFVNELTETRVDNIPTAGVFAMKIDAKSWDEFKDAKKEFWFFDYPKAPSP